MAATNSANRYIEPLSDLLISTVSGGRSHSKMIERANPSRFVVRLKVTWIVPFALSSAIRDLLRVLVHHDCLDRRARRRNRDRLIGLADRDARCQTQTGYINVGFCNRRPGRR